MTDGARTVVAILAGLACAPALGQGRVPLADSVETLLIPAGITHQSIDLNAKLVYVFHDDGVLVQHFIGDFSVSVGDGKGQQLSSREAVVWVTDHTWNEKPYRRLEMLLWRDATVEEPGGTLTTGPALFVTLSTFGEVTTHTDDIAREVRSNSPIYVEGRRIRTTVTEGRGNEEAQLPTLRVIDASGLSPERGDEPPRPVIRFQSRGEVAVSEPTPGRRVLTVTGGAYLARGVPGGQDYLEIQADSAVVFLRRRLSDVVPQENESGGLGASATDPTARPPGNPTRDDESTGSGGSGRQLMESAFGDLEVEAAYLEGDVLLSQNANQIRATRIYYDLVKDRALILDAVVRAVLVDRDVPLYLRADEIRQLSQNDLVAERAMLTTSEFHTPHYHIGAEQVEVIDRSPRSAGGGRAEIRSGYFRIEDATLNIQNVPIGYWPVLTGNVQTSETALRSIRTGYSGDFGVELETRWYLFNLLGLATPDGFDATLNLDYYSDRGPAVGFDATYEREKYFGLTRGYLMHDSGEDSLGRDREETSFDDARGRYLLRHREYLEDDWQLSLELSYISDEGFLEEYFEPEFDNDKEQETLLYLKKQRDNWAFTTLLQTRILDFYTQTERFPDFGFFQVGEPLGRWASWFNELRVGFERYRPADQTFRELLRDGDQQESGTVARAYAREEAGAPLDMGPWRFVPFVSGSAGAWDDSPEDGGIVRGLGTAGVRGTMYLTRVDPEARSKLFDLDGMRHVVKPEIVAWASASNYDSDDLYPFDSTVEAADDFDGATFAVRQRWQTKRGAGPTRRVVDVFTLDLEAGAFNDSPGTYVTNGYTSFTRPELSVSRNYASAASIWRMNDRSALLGELNFDVNDGEVDIFNVSYAVERPPRTSYIIGYRFIGETESNLLALDVNYQMTEKHTLAVREAFDLDRGQTQDFTIALIRKFPRWYSALSFSLDESEDDFGVSFSIWPEGVPQAAIGSRRFTGLATSTRISSE